MLSDSVFRLDNASIRRFLMEKGIEDRTDLIKLLNDSGDEVALHRLLYAGYSVMLKEEQDGDEGEGPAIMRRFFLAKLIRFFIAPFNRTNPATYEVAARHRLKVSAAEGVQLERQLNSLTV